MKIQEKIVLRGKEIPNRILFQPMEGYDGTPDGGIGELTRRRYLRFARSGAGVVWFEATAVCAEGRSGPRQLFLNEKNVREYADLLKEARGASEEKYGYSPLMILQATHSGRYSRPDGTPRPVVAYRNALYEKGKEELPYRVVTDSECDALPQRFAETARLAAEAGFDGIDVKCCHGYLLNEFLNARDRKGRYGGKNLKNRSALFFACFDAAKEASPDDFIVTTRLNAYDGFPYPYGFGVNEENRIDLTETKAILNVLRGKGAEIVNITVGNPYLAPHINRPGRNGPEDGEIGVRRITEITSELQKAFPDLRLVLSGFGYKGIEALSYGEERLRNGDCSLLGFGRMTLAYPDFYDDFIKNGRLNPNRICLACGNCTKLARSGSVAGCPIRDGEVYLPFLKKITEGEGK